MCRTWWCEINCITWALCQHLSDSRWRSLCSSKPPQMREKNPKQTQTPALSLTVTLMFRGRKKNCNLNKSRIIWHLKHRERPNTRENIKAWQRRFVWGPGPCCLVWTLFQSRDLWCLFQGYFFFSRTNLFIEGQHVDWTAVRATGMAGDALCYSHRGRSNYSLVNLWEQKVKCGISESMCEAQAGSECETVSKWWLVLSPGQTLNKIS